MSGRNLHGNAPDYCRVALLLIDVINDFEFGGAEHLFKAALPVAANLKLLKKRAREAGIPAIYVNDNFGRWQSDFRAQIDHCLQDHVQGRPIVEALRPRTDDYYVLKPKHSGFLHTPLEILLRHLGVRCLILTGVAGNICVQFTADDAYQRDYRLLVPEDCVASDSETVNRCALEHMRRVVGADTRASTELELRQLVQDG